MMSNITCIGARKMTELKRERKQEKDRENFFERKPKREISQE